MAEEKVGIIQGLWRFFTFWKLRKALGLVRAANKQFTTSAQGIQDAGDLKLMSLQTRAKDFLSGLSGMEQALEMKRGELKKLKEERATLLKKRTGAANVIEQQTALLGKVTSDEAKAEVQTKIDRAKKDGQAFSARIKELEGLGTAEAPGKIKELETLITQKQNDLVPMEAQYRALLKEIEELPGKTKERIATFTSNKQWLDALERMNHLKSPMETDPMDEVDKMLDEQNAQVKTMNRISQNSTDTTGQEYLDAATAETGGDDFDAFMKARQADKDAKTGETSTKATEERPKI